LLNEERLKIILEKYFERNHLIFEGAYPIKENGERKMIIRVFGKKGNFLMKMGNDGKLWCQSLKGNWFLIESYKVNSDG